MASYYKKIKGKNYDRALLDLADTSTKGKGDGRISINDAKKLFKKIKDSDTYTDIEKRTVQFIRDNYKFTKEADSFFRTEVRKWASGKKESGKKTAVSKKKSGVKKKAAKKPAAKKKTAKKPAAKKKGVKKPAAKKKAGKKPVAKKAATKKSAVKKPAEKREETGFIQPSEPGIREAEAVQSAAAVPERDEEGSRKPFTIFLIVAVIAVVGFFLLPRFRKYIAGDRKVPVEETVTEKGEEADGKKAGEMKEEAAGQKPKKTGTVETEKNNTRPVPAAGEKKIYTVQVKDQLTEIGYKFYGNYHDWKLIYNANRDRIKDPALIFPGQKLVIPEKK